MKISEKFLIFLRFQITSLVQLCQWYCTDDGQYVLCGFAILSVAYGCSSDDWAAFQMFLDATLNPVHLVSKDLESLSLTSSNEEEVMAHCP